MHVDPQGWHRRGWGGNDDDISANERHVIRFALIAAACLFFASFVDRPLVPLLLSELLFLAALGTGLLAAVLREQLFATTLTHWDECLALLATSYGVPLVWPIGLTVSVC